MGDAGEKRGGFGWLWGATVGAALGDGLSMTVLPLLVADQTRDPMVVSLLHVATGLPWLLFGLVAGTVVDRWDRRTVMWRTDAARVVVVALLCALVATDRASVPVVLGAAFVLATGSTLIRSAAPAMLPTLVPKERLAAANGRLQAGATVAGSFIGPAVGGALFVLAAVIPLLTQAASVLVSAVCVRRLPRVRPPTAPRSGRTLGEETLDGVRWILAHPSLRAMASGTILLAAATGILLAVLVIHALEHLGLPPAGYGLLISSYAVGSVAGALSTERLRNRLGVNGCLRSSALVGGGAIAGLAVAPGPAPAAVALLLLGVATMAWNTITVTVRQELTPGHLLGRVTSAFNIMGVGAAPVAALVGGAIAAVSSTSVAIGVAAALCVVAFVRLRRLPGPPPQECPE
ncbi:MFS transporter [Nocardioides zeae]|uniref:MFS family permease n=1 Tax=Nocardioides zeae TaxID=1457234 RepID=A0AAJ1U648_9ACTN|nr:MFS transporter [Nocardioides zeae]MDQ1106263.1 MFS family permease [Nocardioides zeae]